LWRPLVNGGAIQIVALLTRRSDGTLNSDLNFSTSRPLKADGHGLNFARWPAGRLVGRKSKK